MQPETLRAGPIRIRARTSGSSIGLWPSVRVKLLQEICLDKNSDFRKCRFWSQHYDVPINYVGHAEKWDSVDIDGNIKSRDCLVRYRQNGKVLVASIFRDIDSLKAEMSMEAQ
jgi:hypothetical protein